MILASRIAAVAGNTVREAVRNRVLYTLVAFAVVMIGSSILLSNLSYVEQGRILQDLAFASARIFGVVIAIAVGVNLIYKEVERRTIYTILAKPISRFEFLVGKYLGLVATIWLMVVVMGLAFAGVSLLDERSLGWSHAAALGLLGVELAVIVALATLFSAFTTPMLAALFTVGIWVAGNLTRDLLELARQTGVEGIQNAAGALYRVLPDLAMFNLSLQASHGLAIDPGSEVFLPLAYGAAYVAAVLCLAGLIFQRRDFR
jgi:ABC-type transport system involved in multi-copper enzyme maturation permease subunit